MPFPNELLLFYCLHRLSAEVLGLCSALSVRRTHKHCSPVPFTSHCVNRTECTNLMGNTLLILWAQLWFLANKQISWVHESTPSIIFSTVRQNPAPLHSSHPASWSTLMWRLPSSHLFSPFYGFFLPVQGVHVKAISFWGIVCHTSRFKAVA